MFGYVRPLVPQLKVAEYEMYRAVYCGLCRAMGHVTGQISRVTLSYDFTLLAMVRMILCGEMPEFEMFRCAVHPTKKRTLLCPNGSLDNAAASSALLAYLKNRDDIEDEKGAKHARAILAELPMSEMKKRGMRILPDSAENEIVTRMERLGALERENSPSADETADAFGEVLAYVFALGLEGKIADTAHDIGFHIGRFVYICDAADDLTGDIAAGRYNPLAVGWGSLATDENGKMTSLVRDSLEISLPLELETLGKLADMLDAGHPFTPIVKNLVYLGLPASMKRVLYGTEEGRQYLS